MTSPGPAMGPDVLVLTTKVDNESDDESHDGFLSAVITIAYRSSLLLVTTESAFCVSS